MLEDDEEQSEEDEDEDDEQEGSLHGRGQHGFGLMLGFFGGQGRRCPQCRMFGFLMATSGRQLRLAKSSSAMAKPIMAHAKIIALFMESIIRVAGLLLLLFGARDAPPIFIWLVDDGRCIPIWMATKHIDRR